MLCMDLWLNKLSDGSAERARPSDKIECLTLNHIWLAWAENPVQEREKKLQQLRRKGKPVSLATVVRKYSLPKSM